MELLSRTGLSSFTKKEKETVNGISVGQMGKKGDSSPLGVNE